MKKDYPDKTEYLNDKGQFHRDDGPAIERHDGAEFWYQNGLYHRTDGPAIIYPDGTEFWYQNGLLNRTDGPAVIYPNGVRFYFISNEDVTVEVNSFMNQGLSDIEALEILLL